MFIYQTQHCEADHSSLELNRKMLQRRIQMVDCDRARRLKLAARAGDIVRTKKGVFETSQCNNCGAHHKVPLSLKKEAPCPGTTAGHKYFSTHRGEGTHLQTALLNRLLQNTDKKISQRPLDNPSLSKALPKLPTASPRNNDGKNNFEDRPKTSRGRVPEPPTGKKRSTSVEHTVSNRIIAERAKQSTAGPSWRDVFSDTQISSDSSEFDGSEKSVGTMQRNLMREMFAQEEEALRLQLVKEKELHNQNLRQAAIFMCM